MSWLEPDYPLDDSVLSATLHPDEQAEAKTFGSLARRDEYRRSRYLIRFLTGWKDPLPRRPAGDPSWPPGFLGSLTHKSGHVGLALAPAFAFTSFGIDAELISKLKPEFSARVLTGTEPERLAGPDFLRRLAVAFAFKEALFKAHFPLGRKMFFFPDAELTHLDLATGAVAARVLVDTSPQTPTGHVTEGVFRFVATKLGEMVLAAAIIPLSPRA